METSYTYQNIILQHWFKSYYVVWKPPAACQNVAEIRSLNRTMQYGNLLNFAPFFEQFLPFKSYYVVWKLIQITVISFETAVSLNRTMQYGNYCDCAETNTNVLV